MQHSPITHDVLTYTPRRAASDTDAIIRTHSPLVRRIAWHVHSRMSSAIEVEDLIQIGMVALIEAVRTFEDRGISFIPYATIRVRGAMIDELRRDARLGRSGMVNRRRLAQVRAKLEGQLGRSASDADMAEALNLDGDAYHALVVSSQAVRQDSIDEVYSDHDMWFADTTESADTQLEQSQIRTRLSQNIASLPEREAMVLQLYFVEELNLDEIGEALGVGAARICQIKKVALEKLRLLMA
jgi:RNA polymerase sigma factor FliA